VAAQRAAKDQSKHVEIEELIQKNLPSNLQNQNQKLK